MHYLQYEKIAPCLDVARYLFSNPVSSFHTKSHYYIKLTPWLMEPESSLPLSWLESTKFLVLIPISLRSILILSFYLRLVLPEDLFLAGVSVKILKAAVPSYHILTINLKSDLVKSIIIWLQNSCNDTPLTVIQNMRKRMAGFDKNCSSFYRRRSCSWTWWRNMTGWPAIYIQSASNKSPL